MGEIKDYQINTIQMDPATVYIQLKTDQNVNGTLDLSLDYFYNKSSFFQFPIVINHRIMVNDLLLDKKYDTAIKYHHFFIPHNKNTYKIPLTVVNGEAQVKIVVYPTEKTQLTIQNIKIGKTFDLVL